MLKRQIKRFLGKFTAFPPEWQQFLAAVSDVYEHCDHDRLLLGRSLELSSKELTDINRQLRGEIEKVKAGRAENRELEKMNKLMVGRELEMIKLKEGIKKLEEEIAQLRGEQVQAGGE